MTPSATVAVVLALVAGWYYLIYRRSGRRIWSPLWLAFMLTAVALFHAGAGLLGYDVPRHNPFLEEPAVWVGHVVWPQVRLASIVLLASVPFWWLGLKGLRSRANGV